VARVLGGAVDAPAEADAPATPEDAPTAAGAAAPAAPAAGGALASREDALRALGAIAEYFRRSEPHSPLSYTLQEAVRRARMSWPQLLEELVPDEASRSAILNSLGIRQTPAA
jgi:type VI secretion system protein ImpA